MNLSSRAAARVLVFGAASIIAVSGCLDQNRPGFEVVNRLLVPIDVTYLRGDNRILLVEDLPPGNSLPVNGLVKGGECLNESMFATDEAGTVVGTFPGPVCDGTRWEVTAPGSS